MTLCVLDNKPIDKLESIVRELFCHVKNFDVVVPDLSEPACYDEKNTNKMVKFVPVKNKDILTLLWQLPYVEKCFTS